MNCPYLAVKLAGRFAFEFAQRTQRLGKNEIPLFRAMREALMATASPSLLQVEEYHGAKHQVRFTGTGTYSRTNARCELSDLMMVIYDRTTRDARLTYIQAKSERSVNANSHGIANAVLSANLEQWHLLSGRPTISRVGTFHPPPDLLQSALLDSIGAFAFFLHAPNKVDIYYAAASALVNLSNSRNGKVCAAIPNVVKWPNGYYESLSLYGNCQFAFGLFSLTIGTPIIQAGRVVTPVGRWLAGQLKAAANASTSEQRPLLANEIADMLSDNQEVAETTPSFGAKSLLLLGVGNPNDRPDGILRR